MSKRSKSPKTGKPLFSLEEREKIVREAMTAPAYRVVADKYGTRVANIYRWKKELTDRGLLKEGNGGNGHSNGNGNGNGHPAAAAPSTVHPMRRATDFYPPDEVIRLYRIVADQADEIRRLKADLSRK